MPAAWAHCACWDVTPLPLAVCPACGSFQTPPKPVADEWPGVSNRVVCRWVAFPCPFQAAQLPCPRHPALNRFRNHHPVPQVPVSIHGPAGCHVTQRGAAFRVSQPLVHSCWLRALGREMGRRQGFGAGGVVPVSWNPASLAVGGGVSPGTCWSSLSPHMDLLIFPDSST